VQQVDGDPDRERRETKAAAQQRGLSQMARSQRARKPALRPRA
jgi:hypothetical protein